MIKKIFFEDVHIGDEIPALVNEPITEVQIVKYAGASGDFNPLHVVHSFGERAGYGGVIAHGMLIMGFLAQMLTDWLHDNFVKKIGVNFKAVSKPGDTITCRGKVIKKFVEGNQNLVEIEMIAVNQRGEKAATGSAIAILPLKSSK
jgi:acyl dehydratase